MLIVLKLLKRMVNNLGVDPDEWFKSEKKDPPPPFDWEDTAPSEYEPPDEDSNYASRHKSTPDSERGAEEVVSMHEKMYRMATKNGTTITMGGSENLSGEPDK